MAAGGRTLRVVLTPEEAARFQAVRVALGASTDAAALRLLIDEAHARLCGSGA